MLENYGAKSNLKCPSLDVASKNNYCMSYFGSGLHAAKVKHAAASMLIMDSGRLSTAYNYCYPVLGWWYFASYPQLKTDLNRHAEKVNAAYCDGHVASPRKTVVTEVVTSQHDYPNRHHIYFWDPSGSYIN